MLLPSTDSGARAAGSIWGSCAVFCTNAFMESCGPGRITPPTSSCFSLTAIMEMAVSAEMTTSGPALSARAATAPHSSSAPSWAGLSSRSLMPLFSPGPTVRMRALHKSCKAASTRPLSIGTTLPRMPPSICAGDAPYSCNRFTSRMAYSSTVAAGSECSRPQKIRVSCS